MKIRSKSGPIQINTRSEYLKTKLKQKENNFHALCEIEKLWKLNMLNNDYEFNIQRQTHKVCKGK